MRVSLFRATQALWSGLPSVCPRVGLTLGRPNVAYLAGLHTTVNTMDIENSRLNSETFDVSHYVRLICATLKDVAITCNQSDTELVRDQREIVMRTNSEGITFLTRTLPSLGKSLDRALSSGTSLSFRGFKRAKGTKIPRFMRDIFLLVFDVDGGERSDASAQAIRALRQIFYLFYKLNIPPTEKQCNEVITSFVTTDQALDFKVENLEPLPKEVLRSTRNLICRVLGTVDPLGPGFQPRHGPGAVATGEKANEKPIFRRYYHDLAAVFPYDRYFFYNLTHLSDSLDQLNAMEVHAHGTAKVVLVPKDSRGPRLISCEPLEFQWIQQGLMQLMVKTIEAHPLTAGYVNFSSQDVNRQLALDASLSGAQVTLDMKEASDRVSLELVRALFPETWFNALYACRSKSTILPDGTELPLRKFAPMGSAVCFPVEALIFWALSVTVLAYYQQGKPDQKSKHPVFVYGDDIICNTEDHGVLRQTLPLFGLLFNEDKCCIGRFFRESCGLDAYKGVDVTPLKVRALWYQSFTSTDYVSWVAYHNALERRGLFHACDYLAEAIQRIRLTPYADSEGSEVVALVDSRKTAIEQNRRLNIRTRFDRERHVMTARGSVVRPRVLKDTTVPGWLEMQRIASVKGQGLDSDLRCPYSSLEEVRDWLAPWHLDVSASELKRFTKGSSGYPVKAYQYTLPRQVSLRRGWGR